MAARTTRYPFSTVVLCAGESSRWGARGPKALALVGGRTALERIAVTARAGGCASVIAVLGAGADRILATPPGAVDRFVENPGFARGRTGSIRMGLAALPRGSGALIWPVDVPFVEAKTVRALLDVAHSEAMAVWFTPTVDGKGGHPIALSPDGVAFAAALPDSVPFRDAPFRREVGERRVPVDDPGILDNTNTPVEWDRAERAWRGRGGS